MTSMSPVERVLRTMEGKPVDRVPCFSAQLEARQANEILGNPPIPAAGESSTPWINSIPREGVPFAEPEFTRLLLGETLNHRNQAQVEMGFDGMWVYYDDTWAAPDAETLALTWKLGLSLLKILKHGPIGPIRMMLPIVPTNITKCLCRKMERRPVFSDTDSLAAFLSP